MQDLTVASNSNMSRSLSWLATAGLAGGALLLAAKVAERIWRPPVHLRGKVALITGGSRGLGLALAHELSDYGCDLALVARDPAELDEAARGLAEKGVSVDTFPCDITNQEQIQPLLDRVLARFGRIDILINDAGLIKVAPLDNLTHADFDEAMNLMFWAPLNLTFAALPHMKRQGAGHIVNITSVGGRVSVPHLLPYSCAKFAFVGFSTGLSAELNPEHIHVLTVVPGLMRTGSYLNAAFKGSAQQEFGWFSLLGNLPGVSIPAETAARSIREALQRRHSVCTISLPAKLLIQSEALLPEATRAAMQFASQFLLPGPGTDSHANSGKSLNSTWGKLFQAMTTLGRTAAVKLNQ